MNEPALRKLLAEVIASESAYIVPELCSAVGLSDGEVAEAMTGKNRYALTRLRRIASSKLVHVAKKLNDQIENQDLQTFIASLTSSTPVDAVGHQSLANLGSTEISRRWERALARRDNDPEGAITLFRTLIEDVCKAIIDKQGDTYSENAELPTLYRQTATILNLAPDQHTEEIFRTILGNCQSIVGSLAALRNRLSDAHAVGPQRNRATSRHASLAVNLAGAMATFLADTWTEKNPS